MTIHEVETRADGTLVIGGTDAALDARTKDEIRALFGSQVKLVGPDGTARVWSVTGVDTSESLIGRKNVFAMLESTFPLATSPLGWDVHAIAR